MTEEPFAVSEELLEVVEKPNGVGMFVLDGSERSLNGNIAELSLSASMLFCFTHLHKFSAETTRSPEIRESGSSLSRTRRMASSLNSSEYHSLVSGNSSVDDNHQVPSYPPA